VYLDIALISDACKYALEGIAEAFVQRWFLCFFHVDTSRDLILELVLMPFTIVLLYNFLVQNKRGLCNIVQKTEITDILNNFITNTLPAL
jgi:hypothetical protein